MGPKVAVANHPDAVARKQILWVIPVFQSVYARPFGQFLGMALNAAVTVGHRYEFVPYIPERELLHTAMNRAVQIALKHNFDAMIVSDDDCFPPFNAITRLLQHWEHGHEAVMGQGYMRGFPHTTTAGRYYKEGVSLRLEPNGAPMLVGFEWLDDLSAEPHDMVPVDFAGMPIGIVDVKALRRMEAPWFGTEIDGGSCTHDVYFGHKAKKAGIQIYVDRTIACGHLTDAHVVTDQNRSLIRSVAKKWEAAVELEGRQ